MTEPAEMLQWTYLLVITGGKQQTVPFCNSYNSFFVVYMPGHWATWPSEQCIKRINFACLRLCQSGMAAIWIPTSKISGYFFSFWCTCNTCKDCPLSRFFHFRCVSKSMPSSRKHNHRCTCHPAFPILFHSLTQVFNTSHCLPWFSHKAPLITEITASEHPWAFESLVLVLITEKNRQNLACEPYVADIQIKI